MTKPTEGRLVWNHSTHINSLIPVLERLIKQDGIQTVTPGQIGRVKGHCPHLQLRISVPIRGGFKVIARQGKTVQEVFILTNLQQNQLEEAIAIAMKK
ncbi:metal-binding protein [Nostocales cyanobacterium HT-58-2]|nr:metal-binding protein [Nostocales cyanobacterium HT-58-2]